MVVQPPITTFAPIFVPSPISTFSPITAPGPTITSLPNLAFGWTMAVLWMLDSAFSMPTTITIITPHLLYKGKHVFTTSA